MTPTGTITTMPETETVHPQGVEMVPQTSGQQRTVGWLFGVTGLALFTLMALLGVAMRLEQGDLISISPEWFYRLMTLHAAGMLAGALASMMGGLWLVVRSVVPSLNFGRAIASFAAIVTGVVLVLVAVLIGGFAAGWTFLYPLPFHSSGMWSTWSTVTFLVGMALVGVGFVIYCIDVLKATTETYGGLGGALGVTWLRGRAPIPPPPQVIAATAVSLQGIIAGAVGTTIIVALLDHAIDGQVTIDALWAKNLTYFFGHTIANLIIYLAAGMVYVLLPLYAGRQWKTSKPLVIGWLGTITFVLTAYSHHLYMDFVQPGAAQLVSLVASSAAAIPVAVVTIYTGMMLVWGSRYRWTLTSVLLYLGFAGWAIGGMGAVIDSLIPVNFRLHNTLWVPAHFHNYLMMGIGLWMLAFVSYMLERASGRTARKRVTLLAPVALIVGGYGFIFSWYVSGALGIPRRWAVHPPGTQDYSIVASIFAIVFLLGFFAVLAEFISMGRQAWRRRGLATTPSAPPQIAGASPEADIASSPSPQPMVKAGFGLITIVAMAVAAMFVFFPPISDASELNVKYHHLVHAFQFFTGAMLGVAAASSPSFFNRFAPRWTNAALAIVIVVPVAMLLYMIPAIYSGLVDNDFLHASYHLFVVFLGLLTGLGAALLGRVAGWTILATAVGMALMFAPGVSGG